MLDLVLLGICGLTGMHMFSWESGNQGPQKSLGQVGWTSVGKLPYPESEKYLEAPSLPGPETQKIRISASIEMGEHPKHTLQIQQLLTDDI